jgi:Flp pilus assembly secretin CpaC
MAKDKFYDINRMAEIIICLIENFGEDGLIKFLLDRLIRKESDSIVPSYKSSKAVELEKKYDKSLVGVPRKKIYGLDKDMSKFIVLEHGLPEGQAIEMFFKEPKKEKITNILEDVKNNLTYITKEENKKLNNEWRYKGKNGYYWEETYKKANIEPVKNT